MPNPTVTLEFKGDEGDAVSAIENVGSASKTMGDEVGDSSKKLRETGAATEELAEKAGTTEQRFIGFRDTITGTGDVLKGFREGDVITTATGFADIAGGLESFLIPMLGRLGTAFAATAVGQALLTAAQTAWNVVAGIGTGIMTALNFLFISTPIGWLVLAIGGLVAAFIILWNKSAGFRDFFIGSWNDIKRQVGGVVDWIVGAWNGLVGFFQSSGRTIGNTFSSIGSAISGAFKGAVNGAISVLNGLITGINFVIRGINAISPFGDIPGIPKIPKMHTGGIVPGIPGSEHLRILQAGEEVIPASGAGGGGSLTLVITGSGALAELFQYSVRTGDVQLIDSSGNRVQVA
jgi:phage-related protein